MCFIGGQVLKYKGKLKEHEMENKNNLTMIRIEGAFEYVILLQVTTLSLLEPPLSRKI